MSRRIVVAGASLGGLRAVEALRAAGWSEGITVFGAEWHMPYNRPPLTKKALRDAAWDADFSKGCEDLAAATAFRLRPSLGDVEWRLGEPLSGAQLEDRRVVLADGTKCAFDGLVIATGLSPRRLPFAGPRDGRHALRTADDAVSLRARLSRGARVAVVGAGFIGCELAATACELGCEVSVIEPCKVPLLAPLGARLGAAIQAHHERQGITFHLGRTVVGLIADGARSVGGVELDDGSTVACHVLVEAIGSVPNTEWLAGNGLDLSDGVVCDSWLRVERRDELVAVGDIARFPNARYDEQPRRVEHWCVAGDTAKRAARALVAYLGGDAISDLEENDRFAPLPSFWSDQFELRIQGLGAFALADNHVLLEGDPDRIESGAVLGAMRNGELIGVVGVSLGAASMRRYRELLLRSAEDRRPARQAA